MYLKRAFSGFSIIGHSSKDFLVELHYEMYA